MTGCTSLRYVTKINYAVFFVGSRRDWGSPLPLSKRESSGAYSRFQIIVIFHPLTKDIVAPI